MAEVSSTPKTTHPRQTAPGPRGNFLLGSLIDMRRKGPLQTLIDATAEMMERWHSHFSNSTTIDINLEMMSLAMNIIGRTMFGKNVGQEAMAAAEAYSYECSECRPRYAYFPFSVGPRTCLGNHFANLEAHLVLVMIIQRFQLNLVPGFSTEAKAMGTLRPVKGMWMTLHPR